MIITDLQIKEEWRRVYTAWAANPDNLHKIVNRFKKLPPLPPTKRKAATCESPPGYSRKPLTSYSA